jgi:hypothetical protein
MEEEMKHACVLLCGIVLSAGNLLAESSAGKVLPLEDGVTLTVNELHRTRDNTVLFKFTVENKGSDPYSMESFASGDLDGVYLFDMGGRKRYACIKVNYHCLGSRPDSGSRVVPPGEKRKLWVQMTAPPAQVNRVQLQLGDMPPFDGITIDPVPAEPAM